MLFAFMLVVCLFAIGVASTELRDRKWGLGISTLVLTIGGLAIASGTWPMLFGDKNLVWPMWLVVSLGVAAVALAMAYVGQNQEIFRSGSKLWLVLLSAIFGILASLPFMAWTGAAIVDAWLAWRVTMILLILGAIVLYLQGFRAYADPHATR